ncbi:MAG: ParB/RepB/Spo0J family partition protein [bacterium]
MTNEVKTGGAQLKNLEIVHIEIERISRNPFQPRRDFEKAEIGELSESVKTHGLVQPIVVRRTEGGYQLVAGERRLMAVKDAGQERIPAIVVDVDGIDVAEMSLIENIQRKNLNPVEESDAYSVLSKKFGLAQEEISRRVGKSRSHVANILRLQSLPERIKNGLRQELISMGHGKALLSIDDVSQQEEVYDRIIKDSLNVRQAERVAKEIKSRKEARRRKQSSVKMFFRDARKYFDAMKKTLKEIKEAGGKADIIERETESHLEIIVRISKEEMIRQEDS